MLLTGSYHADIANGLHLVGVIRGDNAVKLVEDVIEEGDQLRSVKFLDEVVKIDDTREEDRDVVKAVYSASFSSL